MTKLRTLGIAAAVVAVPLAAFAADHGDISRAGSDPTADLTDLYAWMTDDSSKLNLVMAVGANSGDNAQFSDVLAYIFHIDSMTAYSEGQTPTQIVCKFNVDAMIECWSGAGDYAAGDPSDSAGLVSRDGTFTVFAGLRNDPFYLEYDGFRATEDAAVAAVGNESVTINDDGCAVVDSATSDVLLSQLQSGEDDAAASDFFAEQNVLALVIQIDKDQVNEGGPILGVWADTRQVR